MGNQGSRPRGHTSDEPWAIFPGEAPTKQWQEPQPEYFILPGKGSYVPQVDNTPQHRASMTIQKHIRARQARQSVVYETMHKLRPMLIHVAGAEGLRAADINGASDPFVVVHVVYNDDEGNVMHTFVSKSPCVKRTLNPTWKFDVFLPGVNETMKVVMTVMDWDRFSNDDFLGQVVFPVPPCRTISTDANVSVKGPNGSTMRKLEHDRQHGVALASYEVGLGDLDKTLQPVDGMDGTEEKGQGKMHITIDHFGGMAHTQCGYLFKALPKTWDKKWVVLAGTNLYEYRRWSDAGKPEILDLTRATKAVQLPDSDKFENVFEITFKTGRGTEEKRSFYKCENPAECKIWIQKLAMAMGIETRDTMLASKKSSEYKEAQGLPSRGFTPKAGSPDPKPMGF